jgi:hypothetical protein
MLQQQLCTHAAQMPRELIVTPVGEAWWAKLFEPEQDRFEEDKPRQWSIEWAGPQNSREVLGLMQTIEAEFARLNGDGAKPSKNAWPFKEQTDKEGNPTGLLAFRMRKNETTKKGKVLQAPAIYDSHKNPWPADTLIGNGSKVKVAFSCYGWEDKFGKKGISLSLEAVQVLDLVPYEQRDPGDAFGVENGYVVDTPADAFGGGDKELSPSQKLQRQWQGEEPSEEEVPF